MCQKSWPRIQAGFVISKLIIRSIFHLLVAKILILFPLLQGANLTAAFFSKDEDVETSLVLASDRICSPAGFIPSTLSWFLTKSVVCDSSMSSREGKDLLSDNIV